MFCSPLVLIKSNLKMKSSSGRTARFAFTLIELLVVIAIIGVLTLLNPEHTASLLHETRGHYVLALAAILQFLGVITIKKILDIKV